MRSLIVLCLTIGLIGTGLSPVKASSISALPTPNNHINEVFDRYKRLADVDVAQANGRIQSVVLQASWQVKQLYSAAGQQVQNTVIRSIGAGFLNADAVRLYLVEIPASLRAINAAIDETILQFSRITSKFNADVRQLFGTGESGIEYDDTTNIKAIEEQVRQHTGETEVALDDEIQRVQSEVQQQFSKANGIVQSNIADIVERVRSVLSVSVAQRVSDDLQTASDKIDQEEQQAVANVEAALVQLHAPFKRLEQFLADLVQ